MSRPSVDALLRRLALVPVGRDRFDGGLPDEGRLHVFGGLVASQSLRAASLTVDGFLVHSLHGYFLRPGTLGKTIVYDVERLRDGGSFVTRLVKALQDDQVIFQATISFHRPERGLSHAAPMPEVVRPETLPDFDARLDALRDRLPAPIAERWANIDRPFDHRDPEPIDYFDPKPHRGPKRLWFRSNGPVPDEPNLHPAVVTYATDIGLLDNCIQYHGRTFLDPELFVASIDHAIWFHRPLRADAWLLYVMESPSAESGRGMNFGRIYQEDGTLVASVAQESLARFRKKG